MPTPQTEPHKQDIVRVVNIDVNCTDTSTDVVSTTRKHKDEESGEVYTEYLQNPIQFNHKDHFEVRWGGQPHRIKPGEERLLPYFIAEHFATHLTRHILAKEEARTGKVGLQNNGLAWKRVWDMIIIEVVSKYADDTIYDPGLAAVAQVEELNASLQLGGHSEGGDFAKAAGKSSALKELDLGDITGVAPSSTKAPENLADVLARTGEGDAKPDSEHIADPEADLKTPASVKTAALDKLSRRQLVEEAFTLGVELKGKESKSEIYDKIKAF